MRSEDLAAALARDLVPVRRLASPCLRAALWLAISVGAIAIAIVLVGPREDLGMRLAVHWEIAKMAAAALTAVLAAVAAFHVALPDRSPRWVLLPLPPFLAWLASLGAGCVGDFVRFGTAGLEPGVSWSCLGFILGLSLPIGGAMLFALRHAGPVRRLPTAATGMLSVAMLSSIGLTMVHSLDAALMVLVWHLAGVALAVALALVASRHIGRIPHSGLRRPA